MALPVIAVLIFMLARPKGSSPSANPDDYALRPAIAKQVTPPCAPTSKATNSIPLNAFYDIPASGFDSAGGYLFLSDVPRNLQTFSEVTFHIDGITCLWGRDCAERQNLIYREEILGIPVNQKFDSLYIYHNAFWASPPRTPVYDLVLRYEDGSSVTITIRYGADVLDWSSSPNDTREPFDPNSMVAWRKNITRNNGRTEGARQFLTEIKNQDPSVQVLSIDLYSSKRQSSGCIAAMTTGPSGLVQNAKDAERTTY